MRSTRLVSVAVAGVALVMTVVALHRVSLHSVRADDDGLGLQGSWRLTITSPANCQGVPPACITGSEFTNFYPGGSLTETNTILFATSEPNPPNFANGSDGYGVWRPAGSENTFFVKFQKFLFQTLNVPTSVTPSGKLVANTAIATITGTYTVESRGKLSGPFSITVTTPDGNTVLFTGQGGVQGVRVGD